MMHQSGRYVLLLVSCSVCLLTLAAAAVRNGKPADHILATTSGSIRADAALLDSYIQLLNPNIAFSAQQTGRDDRTTLTVKLTDSSVNKFTPVVSPQSQGITVDVLHTWEALKNLAAAYSDAQHINMQTSDIHPKFPRTSLAIRAASVAPPVELQSITAPTTSAELHSFPPNLLMVPFGSSTAAIAEVMDISYDDTSAAITMQLDIVHDPVTFTQFVPHAPCSVRTDEAHFHYATRPGMAVDGPGLLQALKDSDYKTEGVHIFLKSEPLSTNLVATLTPSAAKSSVGSSLLVDIAVTGHVKRIVETPAAGTPLYLVLTGPGVITSTSPAPTGSRKAATLPSDISSNAITFTDTSGHASFTVKALAVGTIRVAVLSDLFSKGNFLTSIDIIVVAASKLLLLPAKLYRRCLDPATLTVKAVNSVGNPVAGVNVSVAVSGDCNPEYTSTVLTGADGKASVLIRGFEPGAVAVVAAAQGNDGIIISAPTHVIFFDDHKYLEEREQDYYGSQHHPYAHERPDPSRDAWHYQQEATLLATQRAKDTPASSSW